jgi:hypothetical protein
MTDPETKPGEPIRIDAQDARGAEVILKQRGSRMIFIGGLVAFVVFVVMMRLLG